VICSARICSTRGIISIEFVRDRDRIINFLVSTHYYKSTRNGDWGVSRDRPIIDDQRASGEVAARRSRSSMMSRLNINGQTREVDVDPDTPLLWVLRDALGLTGTKYGCGIAQCGACTVHIDGVATRSCSVPVSAVAEAKIITIEGLPTNGDLHPVQKAWIAHDVPQCGYCQSGMIMAVAALLKDKPQPSDADIDAAITNICRCGIYARIRAAIHTAAQA
jgi:isoquinoline 1-oxidoreductase alpha subunit